MSWCISCIAFLVWWTWTKGSVTECGRDCRRCEIVISRAWNVPHVVLYRYTYWSELTVWRYFIECKVMGTWRIIEYGKQTGRCCICVVQWKLFFVRYCISLFRYTKHIHFYGQVKYIVKSSMMGQFLKSHVQVFEQRLSERMCELWEGTQHESLYKNRPLAKLPTTDFF